MSAGALNGASLLSKVSAVTIIGVIAAGGFTAGTSLNRLSAAEDAIEAHEEADSHPETAKKLVELETKVGHLDEQLDDVEVKIDAILDQLIRNQQ